MERKKPGSVPRWADDVELKWVKARMPAPLAEAFQREAQKQGMTVQDFLGHLAESLTGVPYDPAGRPADKRADVKNAPGGRTPTGRFTTLIN